MKKCLFYGTLRKNGPREKTYNFNRFGGQKFVKNWFVTGLSLYNLGYYPCVVKERKDEEDLTITLVRKSADQVLCELHEVEEDSFKKIYMMEKGAGYSAEILYISDEPVYLFRYYKNDINTDGLEKIESGDWCE